MVEDIKVLKKYIEDSWATLTVSETEDTETHFGLKYKFIAPSVNKVDGFVFREQFYWDTYFTNIGLASSGHKDLALGMINNLLDMQRRFGYIPNSSNRDHSGRSQPPFMSSMILAGYAINGDMRWLEDAVSLLETEYHTVWRGVEAPHKREVFEKLSRYYHSDETNYGAEEESGWDHSNRFASRCLDFLPIDLNALLFKYESDIAVLNEICGHAAPDWFRRAEERKNTVNKLMWNEERGMYFDYDYVNKHQSSVASLAAYVPLFVGMATPQQARALVKNLALFKTAHGLTTTAISDTDNEIGHQWMSPNGWAPLHLMVVEGLKRYGYHDEAKAIARAWVTTVANHYKKHGVILEKYNVVDPQKPPTSAMYPDQVGFAWTNAVTLHFINSFLD